MINKRISLAIVAMALSMAAFVPQTALAKLTITQRINVENARIKKFEKSGELTKKEADSCRSDMDDINNKIVKAKEKNGGKLSYKDEGKIEKSLNDMTLKINKLQLEKNVQSK